MMGCMNLVFIATPVKCIMTIQLLSQHLYSPLRNFQTAQVLNDTEEMDHISPCLRSLHWLLFCKRIDFEMLLPIYKALNTSSTKYISDPVIQYKHPHRPQQSSGKGLLSVPRVRTKYREAVFSFFFCKYPKI